MFKPLLLAALLVVSTLPAIQPAQAEGLSIDLMPGVSLRIGEQDNRGRYWDGYDWRDRDWWQGHQGTWVNAIVGATTGMVIAGATTITGVRIITIMRGAIVNTISTIISTMRSITGKADVMTIAIIATMTTMIDGQRPSARLIFLI